MFSIDVYIYMCVYGMLYWLYVHVNAGRSCRKWEYWSLWSSRQTCQGGWQHQPEFAYPRQSDHSTGREGPTRTIPVRHTSRCILISCYVHVFTLFPVLRGGAWDICVGEHVLQVHTCDVHQGFIQRGEEMCNGIPPLKVENYDVIITSIATIGYTTQ